MSLTLPIMEGEAWRYCVSCGKRLIRKPGEFPSRWGRRHTCNKSCAGVLAHRNNPNWRWGGRTLTQAFWSLTPAPLTGCWEWKGPRSPHGYGNLFYRGVRHIAHRLSWEINHGSIPDGLGVLHHCDNPPCVNPDHLFLGDNAANMRDKWLKGRHTRGEASPKAILTEGEVREIRARYPEMTMPALARRYGVARSTIRGVLSGRTWRHVA